MAVDLHMHSTASDGERTPEELAALCAEAGLSTVALTDHNTTLNVAAMTAACAVLGIDVVPACEISARWQEREHHCLAYFVDPDDPVLAARIERVRLEDLARSRRWVENAWRDGIPLSWEDVEARVGVDRVPPFALLADALVEAAGDDPRVAGRRGSLYAERFAPGRPWATEPPWQPGLEEAIAWVREAGGVPVLAHPGASLGPIDPETALAQLREAGLLGVEAWTTWHREATSLRFDELGRRAGLAITAGADFHGPTVKGFVAAPGQVSHNGPEVLEGLLAAASRA